MNFRSLANIGFKTYIKSSLTYSESDALRPNKTSTDKRALKLFSSEPNFSLFIRNKNTVHGIRVNRFSAFLKASRMERF